MDAVPRISRAQSMDALSSMANIAGYRAVVEAAHEYAGFFTGQVTAAGRIPPAKVLVAGAGVAGLAAIGAAGSMGAIVRATDPRPAVADEVKSLGGEYLPVEVVTEQGTDGYAKATSQEYDAAAARLYAQQCPDLDIIITTAQIPGRPAPRLITAEMVATMRQGSVIVDMAAGSGGNVEGSVAGEKVVTDNGVTIVGYTELARRAPGQASQLYGSNIAHLLTLFTPEKDGVFTLNEQDVIAQQMTVVRDGVVTWPPPPVQVAATPAVADPMVALDPTPPPVTSPADRRLMWVAAACATLAFIALTTFAPPSFVSNLTVFALAVVIGYYVIGHVHHALHTPLMSVTNAISGIIILGALVQAPMVGSNPWIGVMALAAVLLASINIVGGFLVTHRMLGMFTRS
ncbi:acyl-CoA dehydrogenase [Platysternon megacephalum]|uniref:proton-translocating NAD(P)(+) transhydrogenase n=1 Tax=Platysternon megacephalum TaxID=55544 RepID=A0A4D9DDJ0_9SAUR|nr:acyl-CoA dehydrogenase [Platysternon megacephalum]